MSETAISVREVHKSFGDVAAVRGVSFDIQAGQVVGFIGANGAGKTTTMRMLATLDIPDSGSVSIFGVETLSGAAAVRRRIGWMPDSFGAYEAMTVEDYLDFFARAYGLSGRERRERVADVIAFTEVGEIADRLITGLSKGMAQRLCLGRTLLHDPDLLILDEPAAGLDPKARVDFKHLVRLLADDGKSIFISSHILSELEDMCDTLLFISDGRIIHHGSTSSLKRSSHNRIVVDVRVCGAIEDLLLWSRTNQGVRLVEQTRAGARLELDAESDSDVHAVLRRMLAEGLSVFEFRQHERRLEDAFIEMVSRRPGDGGKNGE